MFKIIVAASYTTRAADLILSDQEPMLRPRYVGVMA